MQVNQHFLVVVVIYRCRQVEPPRQRLAVLLKQETIVDAKIDVKKV
jgi:hypothetical protein